MADATTFTASSASTAWAQGTGEAAATQQAKSKSDQDLEKIRSKAAQELAKQQAAYQSQQIAQQAALQQQQQAQQQAASLEQQKEQEAWQAQWNAANLTGTYNGQQTQAAQQQQFTQESTNRAQALSELTQQQQNAVAQGNLQLSREIETRKNQLQAEQQAAEQENQKGQLALANWQATANQQNQQGQLALGNFTATANAENQKGQLALANWEATQNNVIQQGQLGVSQQSQAEVARNNRVQAALEAAKISGIFTDPDTGEQKGYTQAAQEFQQTQALQTAQIMGRDANGNITEAARQANNQTALQYAQMQAQLAQSPEDYFQAAALQRNAGSDVTGFLRDVNNIGTGSSSGFRGTMQNLPQTNSMQNIAGQVPGPSQSLSVAQNAAATGQQGAYTSAQNTPAIQPPVQMPTTPGGFVPSPYTGGGDTSGMSGEQVFNNEGITTTPPNKGGFSGAQAQFGGSDASGGNPYGIPDAQYRAMQAQMTPDQLNTYIQAAQAQEATHPGSTFLNPKQMREDAALKQAQLDAAGPAQFNSTIKTDWNAPYTPPPAPTGPTPSLQGLSPPPPPQGFNQAQLQAGTNMNGTQQTGLGPTQDVAQQRLTAFAPTFKQGAQKMAPGALAAMSPTERGLFNSAAKASGINPADFEQSFNRSRLQTSMSAGAI